MARASLLISASLALAALAAPRQTRADDKPPCADEAEVVKNMKKRDPSLVYPKDARAMEHVEAGRRAFGVQQYDKAVEEYTSAGLLDDAPLILYNLGQTYRAAKSYEKAVRQYELFLVRGQPGPEVRALVKCYISKMKAELEHAASTAPLTGPASEPPVGAPARPDRFSSIPDDTKVRPLGSASQNPVAESPPSRWTTTRRIAVGLGATGIATLITGVVFGIQTQGLKDDAAKLCPTTSCANADKANALSDRADTRGTLANMSFGLSAGLLVSTVAFWYLGAPSSASTPTGESAVAPHITSTSVGIAYGGTF